jgi:hypothetical protein
MDNRRDRDGVHARPDNAEAVRPPGGQRRLTRPARRPAWRTTRDLRRACQQM